MTAGAGAILGNPSGHYIVIDAFQQRDVKVVEATSTKLALNLLDVFFDKQTLATSLVTKWEGRNLLNPDTIEGIRCEFNHPSCTCLLNPPISSSLTLYTFDGIIILCMALYSPVQNLVIILSGWVL